MTFSFTCLRNLILEFLASKQLVDVHQLVSVVPKVKALLVPVVQIDVEIRAVQKQNDFFCFYRLVPGLIYQENMR